MRFARSWWRNPEMFWSEMADYTVFSIFLGALAGTARLLLRWRVPQLFECRASKTRRCGHRKYCGQPCRVAVDACLWSEARMAVVDAGQWQPSRETPRQRPRPAQGDLLYLRTSAALSDQRWTVSETCFRRATVPSHGHDAAH